MQGIHQAIRADAARLVRVPRRGHRGHPAREQHETLAARLESSPNPLLESGLARFLSRPEQLTLVPWMAGTSPAMTLQAARTALLTFRLQPVTKESLCRRNIAVSDEAEQ